jgi:hypothetical protein
MVRVDLGKVLPLLGQVVFGENRLDWTGRLARSTVYAFRRVYIEHFRALEIRFILSRMNAIYRANVHASGVLGADAGLGDYVSHKSSLAGATWGLVYERITEST